jgi:hypothetical protein
MDWAIEMAVFEGCSFPSLDLWSFSFDVPLLFPLPFARAASRSRRRCSCCSRSFLLLWTAEGALLAKSEDW